ncbi:uncharacterized protein LOC117227272 isoform X1 [Megalopta genalis]|uniref:uncharacterized protein LOC117227272 isoform X1 n=1 Tax=Megalopta genalis TaxID=115081 RepID=UPI003FCFC68F
MHKCAASASIPPVPPRRKKRKAKCPGTVKSPQGTSSSSLKKVERKRLAPPPPPPPPRTTRRVKSHVTKCHRDVDEEETIPDSRLVEESEETLHSLSSKKPVRPLPRQFEDTDLIPTKEMSNGANEINDARNAGAERAFPLFETLSRKEPDKYPPLLFTLHDFQNVMSNSMPREEDTTPETIVQLVSSIRDIFHESFEHSLDDEEADMCFRVTTTNLPFEKCLDRWGNTFTDNLFNKFDDSNRFVFEDYIDRSSRLNIRRSAGPMFYDNFDEDPPSVPRLTKVRFVIQSPSSSTPDHDLSEDGGEDIDPPVKQNTTRGTVASAQLTEITDNTELKEEHLEGCRQSSDDSDEFGDVPFCTILNNRDDADEVPFEYTCISMDLADRGSPDENNYESVVLKDSFGDSTFVELQNQSFETSSLVDTLKSVNMDRLEISLTRTETDPRLENTSTLDRVEKDLSKRSINDIDPLFEAPINFVQYVKEKHKTEPRILSDLSEEFYEDASSKFETVETTIFGNTNETVDDVIKQKITMDTENTVEKELISDPVASEEKLTINQTITENRTTVKNNEERCNSLMNSTQINTDDQLPVEKQKCDNCEAAMTESFDKSSRQYKRQIFVNESLRSCVVCHDSSSNDSELASQIFKDETDSVEAVTLSLAALDGHLDEYDLGENIDDVKNTNKGPLRRVGSVPVSIRRNSFLENMLCEDEAETWAGSTSCKIVATHPKSSSLVMNEELIPMIEEESEVACQLPDSIKTCAEIWKVTKSKEIPKKIDTSVSNPRSPNDFQSSKKHASEVKCDVLNELLSNFSKLKLRPVNNEKQGSDGILQVSSDKETSALTSEIYEAEKVHYTRHNKNPTGSSQSSRQMRTSMEGKNSSGEFSFRSTSTTELSGFPAGLDRKINSHTEIVKVDVHRSEHGDDEDDLKVSSNVLETYDESRFPRKNIVSNEKGDMSAAESSMLPRQVASCSEKTDAENHNDEELDDRGPVGEQLDLSRRTGSGAKSAIARRIPQPHCNNNDNNRAVTSVAVSDDQSRDTVTITPGRVRSFVKYYEIRRDATTDNDSKTNDRDKLDRDEMPGHQSVFSIRRGLEARAIKGRPSEFRKDTVQTSVSVTSAVESARTKGSCAAITDMLEEEHSTRLNDSVEVIEDLGTRKDEDTLLTSPSDSTSKFGKAKRKKSVQFEGGHTVIGAKCSQDAGPLGSPANQVPKSPRKSKALGRPTTVEDASRATEDSKTAEQNDWVDAGAWSFNKREIAAQIQAAAGRKEFSGEEVVTVPPTSGGQDSWKTQTLSLSSESPGNRRRGYHQQLQAVPTGKRTRPAPPPPPISCKVNAKDINKYFDWPNKENRPGNAVNTRNQENGTNESQVEDEQTTMGSNLSRHNGKGLTGRRTQSSGNLCEPKGKLNSMGKILVPCSSAQRERYKFCGSLPNHLDDKDVLDDDSKENNNIMTDTIAGNLGGTLPHKKRSLGVHFSDGGPTGALDLVKHRSQDSIDENDPWRYQQSDLDLVRCRHGNFDSVRRNRSTDTVSSDSSRRYNRGSSLEDRCHRNSDLDLVGTLPKRKQDTRNGRKASDINSSSSQPSIPDATENDLLMQIVHKPDCELVRHRQQLSKCIDLKLSKLAGGEPQDQGYASERSPEDEHPPSLPGQPFPNITPESTFRVTLQKSSRGLGLSVSGGGTAGPVRVKRLFPQQPAALSNKLQPGDILLAANGIPLTGLTNYEALEVLRTTPSTVELVVCRLPGDTNVTPPGAPPPPPARREPPPPLRILNPLPPLQIEPCGEFDIEMTKVGGSLGFTLRKADSSALGHYVRALVREPALSDGRIRPGDKIVAVDGAPLSPMSHEEAVQLLRQCGPTVKLRLYRDLAQTPVSALSPTEPDHPLRPPRTSLRQEAVDMLCDLAVRKLSPGTSSGSSCKQSPGASCNSPRRLRRLATRTPTENDQGAPEKHSSVHTTSTASQAETSDSDQCSIRTQITNSQPNTPGTDIIDPPPLYDVCDSSDSSKTPARPSFLDLTAPQGKPHFQFCSLDSDLEYPGGDGIAAADDQAVTTPADYERRHANILCSDDHDNNLPSEPASMPPVLSSTSSSSTAAFSYKNPAYQSANPACGAGIDTAAKNKATHSSDQDIPGKILGAEDPAGSKGLLKWKGVMFAPDDGIDKTENEEKIGKDTTDSAIPNEELEQGTEVFMVELTRGWNSRLGFSLQPEGNHTVISVVHPDSVAAKDGRLKQGDVLLMVNDESVKDMSTADIIDLLRKIRGSIGITVMRQSKRENVT